MDIQTMLTARKTRRAYQSAGGGDTGTGAKGVFERETAFGNERCRVAGNVWAPGLIQGRRWAK